MHALQMNMKVNSLKLCSTAAEFFFRSSGLLQVTLFHNEACMKHLRANRAHFRLLILSIVNSFDGFGRTLRL
jgi:hypothetical protein